MPETEVIEAPPGKTSIGDKYRSEMSRLQPPGDDKSPAQPEKKEETTSPKDEKVVTEKAVSAFDAALGEPKEKVEPKWEDEPILKEFDPKQINWNKARQKLGEQSLEIKRLSGEVEASKKAGTQVDPKTLEDLAAARKEVETLKS